MGSWTQGLGITKNWGRDDLAEVTVHSKELWQKMKEQRGWGKCMPCREIPGFFACLQEMYDGGYSFTDIAAVFGLSRERVRQLFREEPGLRCTDTGPLYRYWDQTSASLCPSSPAPSSSNGGCSRRGKGRRPGSNAGC